MENSNGRGAVLAMAQPKKQQPLLPYIKNHWWLYIMMIPGVVALILFSYIPMYGIVIAFQDSNTFDGFLEAILSD